MGSIIPSRGWKYYTPSPMFLQRAAILLCSLFGQALTEPIERTSCLHGKVRSALSKSLRNSINYIVTMLIHRQTNMIRYRSLRQGESPEHPGAWIWNKHLVELQESKGPWNAQDAPSRHIMLYPGVMTPIIMPNATTTKLFCVFMLYHSILEDNGCHEHLLQLFE